MYGRIVMAAHAERTSGKPAAVFHIGLRPFPVQQIQQRPIFSLARHDHHILEVLGTGANQRNAAYVYLFR